MVIEFFGNQLSKCPNLMKKRTPVPAYMLPLSLSNKLVFFAVIPKHPVLKICSPKALYFYLYGSLQIRRNPAQCIVQSACVKVLVLRGSYWNKWMCPRFFKISVPCILLISNLLWQAGIFYTRSLFNVIPNSAHYNTIAIILSK